MLSFTNDSKLEENDTLPIHTMRPHLLWYCKQRYHRKLKANIADEYTCRNPQQTTNELISTIYGKDNTLWSSEV